MSEKFKELLAVLMAYNIPFRFRDRTISTGSAWVFGYTMKNGEEIRVWEIDDIPNREDVLLWRNPENMLDDELAGLSVNSIMLHILAREMEENGVDYNDDRRV